MHNFFFPLLELGTEDAKPSCIGSWWYYPTRDGFAPSFGDLGQLRRLVMVLLLFPDPVAG